MVNQRHGVFGKSDPNFKPDPNLKHVYDKEKGVYRAVKVKPEPKQQPTGD